MLAELNYLDEQLAGPHPVLPPRRRRQLLKDFRQLRAMLSAQPTRNPEREGIRSFEPGQQ
jgi:hypothetical protein